MLVRLRYIFLSLIVSLALAFNLKNGVAQLPLEKAIARLISEQMATQHIPGLALAITQGDKILYAKGYGVASSSQPVTVQTQFFIASISKSFTAAAIMQLVEAGKIIAVCDLVEYSEQALEDLCNCLPSRSLP